MLVRIRTAWKHISPQRRSALVSLVVLCGVMVALLLYQRPQPEQAPQPLPSAAASRMAPETAPQAPVAAAETAARPTVVAPDMAPFDYPLNGQVTAGFGWTQLPGTGDWRLHGGIDISGQPGDAVVAAAMGTVREVEEDPLLGSTLVLDHGGGRITRYASVGDLRLQPGDRVQRGQVVGRLVKPSLGEDAGGSHLHFAVEVAGELSDPIKQMTR